MKLLKQLYEIHSPSGKETRIRTFIESYIGHIAPNATFESDKIGNLYITKGVSETYPCIVAHLDQVQRHHSKDFRAVETRDIIFGYSPSKRRKEGLGADDKNGIWIALQCLVKYDVIKIAFFVGEEVGCVGSNAADLSFFEDCRFVIQPDRRGYSDVITEISWASMCSEEFLADIQPDLFGYVPEGGMMTDIEALRDRGLELSCINVSCGYYEPHTDEEFTVKKDMLNCLDFVQYIVENCTKAYHHEPDYHHQRYQFRDDCYYSDLYDYYIEMIINIRDAHPGYSMDDIWEVYSMNFACIEYEEFEAIYEDTNFYFEDEKPAAPKAGRPVDNSKKKKKGNGDAQYDSRSYTFFSHSEERERPNSNKSA